LLGFDRSVKFLAILALPGKRFEVEGIPSFDIPITIINNWEIYKPPLAAFFI